MPRVVVRFSHNPSEESESLIRQAETSRSIIELARIYQWGMVGPVGRHGMAVMEAAKRRARQLGFRVSELEADQRGILRRNFAGMDATDVRREADKRARDIIRGSGASSKAVRGMLRDSVVLDYRRAVESDEVPAGMQAAWLEGWRKGYGDTRRNLTDRAQRYRANAEPPEGPKRCFMCGTRAIDASGDSRLMVGHLDGHESHNEPENLVWTCRSCNTLHANALKRARMGRRTAQFNPTKSGGAFNVGEWANAVGAIRAKRYPENRGREGALGAASTMSVSDAVAMIRATPQHKRQQFAAALGKHKAGRRGASDIPF